MRGATSRSSPRISDAGQGRRVGLAAEEDRAELAVETEWSGMAEIEVSGRELDQLYDQGVPDLDQTRDLPCHTGVVLLSGNGSALGRVMPSKELKLIKADRDAFGIHGRSAEQRVALDLLLDPSIGIVSLGGRAGTGKSAWRSARDSKRCWSGGSTRRSWCSGRCTRWAVRISAIRPGRRGRRWRPGPRLCSTPSARSRPSW